jgi:hypothetical protein
MEFENFEKAQEIQDKITILNGFICGIPILKRYHIHLESEDKIIYNSINDNNKLLKIFEENEIKELSQLLIEKILELLSSKKIKLEEEFKKL